MAFRMNRGLLAVLGLSLILPLASMQVGANNTTAIAEGKIAGKVVDADGKAVADLEVQVLPPRKARGAGGEAPKSQDPAPGAGGGRMRPKPVATGKTDAEGAFTISVAAGEYQVVATKKDGDTNWVDRKTVTVKEGETVTADLKLAKAPARRGGGAPGAAK